MYKRQIEDVCYVIASDYTFGCLTTTTKTYPPPFRFVVKNSPTPGAGSATWTNPALRYDSYRVILRYASGSIPPATISSGTGVPLLSDFSTSAIFAGLAPGTYSFSLFVTYDEMSEPPDSDDFSSPAATDTVSIT